MSRVFDLGSCQTGYLYDDILGGFLLPGSSFTPVTVSGVKSIEIRLDK